MLKKFVKLTNPRNLSVFLLTLLGLFVLGALAHLAYADGLQDNMDTVAVTFMDILTGPVSKITGGLLVIVGVAQLIQRNWSAGGSLLLAAILLIKLHDLMIMFGGK